MIRSATLIGLGGITDGKTWEWHEGRSEAWFVHERPTRDRYERDPTARSEDTLGSFHGHRRSVGTGTLQERGESPGTNNRARKLGFGSTSRETSPAIVTRKGTPRRFSTPKTGSNASMERPDAHASRNDAIPTTSPAPSASITTGQPFRVPASRPAKISLGAFPCPVCGSSARHAEPIRRARRMLRCRWES